MNVFIGVKTFIDIHCYCQFCIFFKFKIQSNTSLVIQPESSSKIANKQKPIKNHKGLTILSEDTYWVRNKIFIMACFKQRMFNFQK